MIDRHATVRRRGGTGWVFMLTTVVGLAACATGTVDIATLDPRNALAAGVGAADGGHDAEAVALLTRALDSGELNDAALISAYIWRARAFNDLGKHPRAIEDADAALAIDSESPDAYAVRGRARLSMGDFDSAIFDFDSALALDPAHPRARFYRGVTFLRTGDDTAALADFTASLRLDPEDVAAYKNRGFAWLRARNYRHAIDDFSAAIDLGPDDDVGYFFRGFARYFAGDYTGAVRDLGTAAAQPGSDNVYDALAYYVVLARTRSPGEARARLRELVDDADLAAWPAPLVRMMLGDITPAEAMAAAADPDPAVNARRQTEAAFHAGQYHLLNGDRDAATAAFRRAVAHEQVDHIGHVASLVELARLRAALQ